MPEAVPSSRQVVLDTTDARSLAEFCRRLLGLVCRPGVSVPQLDRREDPDEPLRVYADPAGHPFGVFVA